MGIESLIRAFLPFRPSGLPQRLLLSCWAGHGGSVAQGCAGPRLGDSPCAAVGQRWLPPVSQGCGRLQQRSVPSDPPWHRDTAPAVPGTLRWHRGPANGRSGPWAAAGLQQHGAQRSCQREHCWPTKPVRSAFAAIGEAFLARQAGLCQVILHLAARGQTGRPRVPLLPSSAGHPQEQLQIQALAPASAVCWERGTNQGNCL